MSDVSLGRSTRPTRPASFLRLLYLAGLAVLFALPALIAIANPFGPTEGCCRYADSSTHTWLDAAGTGGGAAAWEFYFEAAMDYDLAPTDMSEAEVTYHNIGTNYVDVEWYTSSLEPPAIGVAQCILDVPADPTRFNHWQARFN